MKRKELGRYRNCIETTEVRCLIFDFDGTLAETEEAIERHLTKHFTQINWAGIGTNTFKECYFKQQEEKKELNFIIKIFHKTQNK